VHRPVRLGLAAGVAAVAVAGCVPPWWHPSPKPEKTTAVQLLAINDFHGNLEPPTGSGGLVQTGVDAAGKPVSVSAGGVSYLAQHLNDLRKGHKNTLTVAAGDMIGASPLTSALFHDEPTIEALNKLKLDVTSVGNHEFDEGITELLRIQNGGCHPTDGCQTGHQYQGADFPYLAANVVSKKTGKPVLPPYLIKKVGDVKIGFIGETLKGTPDIVSAAGIKGLEFKDEATTANRYVKELQSKGVQSIVLLLHQGGAQSAGAFDVNGCTGLSGDLLPILDKLSPAVDAVLSAHTHQAYNCQLPDSTGHPRLVTSGASFGRLVTDIDLTISNKTKDVVTAKADNVIVTRDKEDPKLAQLVKDYQAKAAPLANKPVGKITADVTRNPSAVGETPLGDLIADSQRESTGAQVAFMNPGGVRADLPFPSSPAGEGDGVVTYGEAFTVQPFNNLMVTKTFTGQQLLDVLNQQAQTGTDGSPILRLLQPSGITYSWSAAARAVVPGSVAVGGAPLDLTATYTVAMNNFLSDGGDGFAAFKVGTNAVNGQLDIDAFTAYLTAHQPVSPPAPTRVTPAS
jgi:5'-nucleotidase